MTGLNIRNESHLHESILFRFPGRSDDAIVINYCILYAKHYIYIEFCLKNMNQNTLKIDFFGLPVQAQIYIKSRKKAYVFTIIKVSSLISLILYMITYRLHVCDFLM